MSGPSGPVPGDGPGPTVDVTDDQMRSMMATTRPYTIVLLKAGPAYGQPGTEAVVWEHGRRNFALRATGELCIVCPVLDDSDLRGVGIFTADVDQVRRIMDGDPGVAAGLFTYEVHPSRSFPGDRLGE